MTNKISLLNKVALWIVVILALIFALFPLYWMLTMSVKRPIEAVTSPPIFLFKPQFDAYIEIWDKVDFIAALFSSVVCSLLATAIAVLTGTLSGYAFARYRFTGRRLLSFGILSSRMLPPICVVVPVYLLMIRLGLYDTHYGLALALMGLSTPLATWLLIGYFSSIPPDMEQCAMIDGASRFKAVLYITIPLVVPGMVATSIFSFTIAWNNFLFPLVLASGRAKTLPVVIAEYIGETGIVWTHLTASATVALIPVIIFNILVHNQLKKGLAAGALKG
jgi:multiple sugar transport system permease protein